MNYSKGPASLAVIATLISSVLLSGPASSETTATVATSANVNPDDPITHYRAYETAIAAGDLSGASTAAVTAWRTGERVWNGNNPNLPGLAFNAAWTLGLANKIVEAKEPAQRALELSRQFPASVDAEEAGYLLAYATMVSQPTKRHIEAFGLAARAVDNGGWGDFLLARSYAEGALLALNVQMPRVARDLVDRGLTEINRIAPDNAGLKTNLLVLRTQSSLQSRQFGLAVREVMDARRSYGPPRSDRDLNWAGLVAWESAARAVHYSVYGLTRAPDIGSNIVREDRIASFSKEEARALQQNVPGCPDGEWKRKGSRGPAGINFPPQALNDGYAGGALVRAKLDGEGRVIETDIRASLPRASFGTAAVEGIRNWQYEMAPDLPAQCRFVDIVLAFAFAR
jgi:TonB family protein